MIDIIFEHHEELKEEKKQLKNKFFIKRAFNYVIRPFIKSKQSTIDYTNSSIVDSSIISFLITIFKTNFQKINVNFIINDYINTDDISKIKAKDIDFVNTVKCTYKYMNYTLDPKEIPVNNLSKGNTSISQDLKIQSIFYDYSRYLNEDQLCDYKRTIALFYTFNCIFESKRKIEYNLDNLFYYIFGFFDYKYVLMIKNKLDYIKSNKEQLESYISEIDLRKSKGIFESLFGDNSKHFQNELEFKNNYKMLDNEIIYNLMNFEEFFSKNRWGISIGFYESLKFMTFIKIDWNKTDIKEDELNDKIANWYKDITELSDYVKNSFKMPQLMQYSNYIFDY